MNVVGEYKHGKIIYNTRDVYIGKSLEAYGQYCEEEVDVFSKYVREGDTVLDIGANIGVHTIPLSKMVGDSGRVIAFEPQMPIYNMLCGNLAINEILNVRAHNVAVGMCDGEVDMPKIDYKSEDNFGGFSATEGVGVRRVFIDDFVDGKVDFIKIDVEGWELDVLRGAMNTIYNHKPVLYFENDIPDKSEELLRYVDRLGYKMYWHKSLLYPKKNFKGNSDNIFNKKFVCVNVLALDRGREFSLSGINLEEITDFSQWMKLK